MENTTKHPGGRPRKYAEGPGRYSITLSPADKDLVEKFLLWVQFHLGKRMGVAEVLLEGVRGSALYTEFVRATGYTPGRPAAEPASLSLFTEMERAPSAVPELGRVPSEVTVPVLFTVEIPKAQEPVKAAPVASKPEALPVPAVTLQAPPTREEQAPEPEPAPTFLGMPFTAITVPKEAEVLALVRAAQAAGKSAKAIALGAGVDLTALYRGMKGKPPLTVENRKKLFEYLKG